MPERNFLFKDYLLRQLRLPFFLFENVNLVRSRIHNWHVLFEIFSRKTGSYVLNLKPSGTVKVEGLRGFIDFWNGPQNELAMLNNSGIKTTMRGNLIKTNYKGKTLGFFANTYEMKQVTLFEIGEQFLKEQYGRLSPKGRVVVDIGGALGDTAMYFAINGATHVYAYEPDKKRYGVAKKNIAINKMTSKITFLNKPSGTLSQIIAENKIGKGALLKIDCEGCEYNLILGANEEELGKFDRIILEYHFGYLDLKRKLEAAGFVVEYDFPPYYNGLTKESQSHFGPMLAHKKG